MTKESLMALGLTEEQAAKVMEGLDDPAHCSAWEMLNLQRVSGVAGGENSCYNSRIKAGNP